jgi:hypothetical protein
MTQHSFTTLSNTSATRLTPIGLHSGLDITLQNVNASGYIYVGGTAETSSTNYGFRIMPNHSISFELPSVDSLYAIASDSSMKLAVIQTSLESGA